MQGLQIISGTKRKSRAEAALEMGGLALSNNLSFPLCVNWPLEWVSRIDLITDGATALWGPSLSGAIVSITTKTGDELAEATGIAPSVDVSITSPLGYQTPAEFYAPTYPTEKARRSMVPDYRTTLYWNPSVELDEFGRATVEFYTSDAPTDYNVIVEGVSQQGKIIQLREGTNKN